jgi:ArsR family transcriptional regulator
MTSDSSTAQVLLTVSEPTRLRILNCLAAAPLFVSDLQAILKLPQPTVSRHLKVLREAGVVRDTPVAQYVLYRIRRAGDAEGRLLNAILDGLGHEESFRTERQRASDRSRNHPRIRVLEPIND